METTIETIWSRSKVLVKSLVIGVLILLLLIPVNFVQDLVAEREARQQEAIAEVSSKWAAAQRITGPVLALPYLQTATDSTGKAGTTKHTAYFLPDVLNVQGSITPQQRSRGIYKVMLYTAQLHLSGSFDSLPIEKLHLAPEQILWNEAYVKMDIADVKGLNDELKLSWNDSILALTPQHFSDASDGMMTPIALQAHEGLKKFSLDFAINGSEKLLLTPLGKITQMHLTAPWPHPSFTGNMLPQTSTVTKDGFNATWKSLAHKRAFPQYWTDTAFTNAQLNNEAFGVDLFIPVNDYQKTMRSVKYAALCILLTFAAFFLIETTNKKSVHPFQYGLMGVALVLFYMLLLSISEYTGFNIAYGIATVATIALIGWFVKDVLASVKLSGVLSLLLLLVYVYVFTILQLQDFALLLGSIGLFLCLAAIMYYSKKWTW